MPVDAGLPSFVIQWVGYVVTTGVVAFRAYRAATKKSDPPKEEETRRIQQPEVVVEEEPTYDGQPMSEEGGVMFKERCDDLDRKIKSAEGNLDRKVKELERIQGEQHVENRDRLDDLSRRLDSNTRDLRRSIDDATNNLRELMTQRNVAGNSRTEQLLEQLLQQLNKRP